MEKNFIPYNKPYLTGKEAHYMYEAVHSGKISGNGKFTQKCQQFFESKYGFKKCLLTTSCTDALEMAALLMDIQAGDEVIMPAYTFVSTANAFVLRGAKIVFADSCSDHPNIDATQLEALITAQTKAIVVVHYGGMACDMDRILEIAHRHALFVVEDAAQAIDAYYKEHPLGSMGHLATFSFHETKNIISGEGGMLAINDEQFIARAEVIWEKGTNRSAFFRGEVQKYEWVDIGSSFLPSDITAAFLFAQLEELDDIQTKRKHLWQCYYAKLKKIENEGKITLPVTPAYGAFNGNIFYVLTSNLAERDQLIQHLRAQQIHAVFHYLALHESPFYASKHDGRQLPNCDQFANCLIRLPLFYELTEKDIERITKAIVSFYSDNNLSRETE
ncbi:MAG: dTDP-4-amino-4,6-dideoxygalactose transaminase [Flammeovirgaceae bacterium]